MNDLPKVFTVLDEINELHRELLYTLRVNKLIVSEERVARLFAIARQQALDIHELEQKLASVQPAYLVRAEQIPPGHILVDEATLVEAFAAPSFDYRVVNVLKVRIRELFKKRK